MQIDLEIIQPCDEHARIVMDWRNDPTTLQAAFNQEPKEWGPFRQEFRHNYFSTASLPPLFALLHGQRVAFLRFRPFCLEELGNRRICDISINVAPEKRGRGLGTPILQAVAPVVAAQGYDDIIAEVKEDNAASHTIFQRAGYVAMGTEHKQGANITRYRLQLTPSSLGKHGVYIIAEAGSNWRMGTPERDMAMARALVDVAVESGADAVKFQVYRANTVYVENAGQADYLAKKGMQQSISSIFQDLAMPYEMLAEIAEYCRSQYIDFMASTFSEEDFAAVNPYVDIHKIASYEIGHIRLLQLAARSEKPLVLSTGAATQEEISWAVDTFRANGGKNLTLLQCTAKYPADPASLNLRVIPWLKQRFGVACGLSDHSRDPIAGPTTAVALGATVIEKHFTLDNRLPGPDHYFALTPTELRDMVRAIRHTETIIGSCQKSVMSTEEELRSYARRGVQAITEIEEGDTFEEGKNIGILRPGQQIMGVHPKHIDAINGAQAKRKIPLGDGIQHGDW